MTSYKTIKQTTYGNASKHQIDRILLCLHSDDGKQFLNQHKEFLGVIDDSPETFEKYLAIERDIGSDEIARVVATELCKSNSEIRVDVVEVLLPRGIVDVGRVGELRGVRTIFDKKKYKKISALFSTYHRQAHGKITDIFDQLAADGLWVDIHTMAPFSPKIQSHCGPDPLIPHPGRLADYNRAYTHEEYRGEKRSINLATETNENPGVSLVEDNHLRSIESSLLRRNLEHNRNSPHAMTDAITAAHLLKMYGRGLFIDFPKHTVTGIPPEQAAHGLHCLVPSQDSILDVAVSIAEVTG